MTIDKKQLEETINSEGFYVALDKCIANADLEVDNLTDKIMEFLERRLLQERIEVKRLLHPSDPSGHYRLTIQVPITDKRDLPINKFELKSTDPKLNYYVVNGEQWLEIEETPNTLRYMTNVCNYINNEA